MCHEDYLWKTHTGRCKGRARVEGEEEAEDFTAEMKILFKTNIQRIVPLGNRFAGVGEWIGGWKLDIPKAPAPIENENVPFPVPVVRKLSTHEKAWLKQSRYSTATMRRRFLGRDRLKAHLGRVLDRTDRLGRVIHGLVYPALNIDRPSTFTPQFSKNRFRHFVYGA